MRQWQVLQTCLAVPIIGNLTCWTHLQNTTPSVANLIVRCQCMLHFSSVSVQESCFNVCRNHSNAKIGYLFFLVGNLQRVIPRWLYMSLVYSSLKYCTSEFEPLNNYHLLDYYERYNTLHLHISKRCMGHTSCLSTSIGHRSHLRNTNIPSIYS